MAEIPEVYGAHLSPRFDSQSLACVVGLAFFAWPSVLPVVHWKLA